MKILPAKSNAIFQKLGVVLLAAAGALSIGIAVGAAAPASSPRAQASASHPAGDTFQGEVWPDPDSGEARASTYMLYDENHDAYFSLEGKQLKKPLYKYAMERVAITGTLDEKSQTVHIESIKKIRW